jgi:hypothetical protein
MESDLGMDAIGLYLYLSCSDVDPVVNTTNEMRKRENARFIAEIPVLTTCIGILTTILAF